MSEFAHLFLFTISSGPIGNSEQGGVGGISDTAMMIHNIAVAKRNCQYFVCAPLNLPVQIQHLISFCVLYI